MQFEFPKADNSQWAFEQEGASIFKNATWYYGSKSEAPEKLVQSRPEESLLVFYQGMIFVLGAYPKCERGPLWSYIIGFNSADSECGIARWVRYTVCYKTGIR